MSASDAQTSARGAGRVLIGTSGWSYPDWAGVVYPCRRPRGFHPLRYLAEYCDAVEVNTSFYRIPSPAMTRGWPALVPDGFRFAFKLTRIFTHEPDLPDRSAAEMFLEALEPVRAAGKLGPVLIQFPWSLRYTPVAIERIERLATWLGGCERVIEVRHASWARPEAQAALAACGGLCAIDQPALRDCLGPSEHVAGRASYVRLHGRNEANWFAQGLPAYERYNYLYALETLREWVDRIRRMQRQAEIVYVFANNHYRGQGVVNALELRALLTGRPVRVPERLLAAYPRLARIAQPPRQPGLFDDSVGQ